MNIALCIRELPIKDILVTIDRFCTTKPCYGRLTTGLVAESNGRYCTKGFHIRNKMRLTEKDNLPMTVELPIPVANQSKAT